MMDFTDLYLQHSHLGGGGPRTTGEDARGGGVPAAAGAAFHGKAIHELVGGTLSAQEYSDRLDALEQRVGSFEEKLMNLTRLIKLSQGLQAEKDAEVRKENEELRARLVRQEHITTQLLRELDAVKRQSDAKASAEAVKALETNLQATTEALRGVRDGEAKRAKENGIASDALAAELNETKTWARRNLQRLKDHVDALSTGLEEVRGGHSSLSSRVEKMDCRADHEYKKLRLILQQKGTEADAMAALIDKELQNVRQVAQRHEVLGSPEVNPAINVEALKFRK